MVPQYYFDCVNDVSYLVQAWDGHILNLWVLDRGNWACLLWYERVTVRDIEPMVYWCLDFWPICSLLILGLVITIPWILLVSFSTTSSLHYIMWFLCLLQFPLHCMVFWLLPWAIQYLDLPMSFHNPLSLIYLLLFMENISPIYNTTTGPYSLWF